MFICKSRNWQLQIAFDLPGAEAVDPQFPLIPDILSSLIPRWLLPLVPSPLPAAWQCRKPRCPPHRLPRRRKWWCSPGCLLPQKLSTAPSSDAAVQQTAPLLLQKNAQFKRRFAFNNHDDCEEGYISDFSIYMCCVIHTSQVIISTSDVAEVFRLIVLHVECSETKAEESTNGLWNIFSFESIFRPRYKAKNRCTYTCVRRRV